MESTQLSDKAKNLGSWLGIKLEISLFGVTILKWQYPPEKSGHTPVEMVG